MAQTKKKRRSKHRGTAAGTIEARGRTGRKAPAPDAKTKQRGDLASRRAARMSKPPSWNQAIMRGGAAAAIFFVLAVALFDQEAAQAIYLAVFALLFYIPLGYYTDLLIYKRNQKRQAAGGARPTKKS